MSPILFSVCVCVRMYLDHQFVKHTVTKKIRSLYIFMNVSSLLTNETIFPERSLVMFFSLSSYPLNVWIIEPNISLLEECFQQKLNYAGKKFPKMEVLFLNPQNAFK